MGNVVSAHIFSLQKMTGLLQPIIYCCAFSEVSKQAISLNKQLSEKLIRYQPKQRTIQIEACFADIIMSLPDNSVIKDFDVLFNPNYKVDILKIMVSVCKKKSFRVIWPGRFENNRLIYAEEEYEDYKVYEVDSYDITCVI